MLGMGHARRSEPMPKIHVEPMRGGADAAAAAASRDPGRARTAVTTLHPLRLPPGTDLRTALEALARERGAGAFVLSGIGSLCDGYLRLAGAQAVTLVPGPLEILTVAGSLTPAGAHLHLSVADAQGRVVGGHAAYGNVVRTTAELLLAFVPGWRLTRAPDPVTGAHELVVCREGEGP
jgi:predicted DNA-binding protein with PD1-like motif